MYRFATTATASMIILIMYDNPEHIDEAWKSIDRMKQWNSVSDLKRGSLITLSPRGQCSLPSCQEVAILWELHCGLVQVLPVLVYCLVPELIQWRPDMELHITVTVSLEHQVAKMH